MIRRGESPEGGPYNKFIGFDGEGHRGILVDTLNYGTIAIIQAKTTSFEARDGIREGRLYLVEEKQEDNYPVVITDVTCLETVNQHDLDELEKECVA